MPEASPRGGFFDLASDLAKGWVNALCLTGERSGVARLVCVFALFALLLSAISPVDDLAQSDFSRHSSSWHRIVTASKLVRASHLSKRDCTAAPIVFGAYAGPILHSMDHAAPVVFLACSSSPGCGRAHTGRAPPAS